MPIRSATRPAWSRGKGKQEHLTPLPPPLPRTAWMARAWHACFADLVSVTLCVRSQLDAGLLRLPGGDAGTARQEYPQDHRVEVVAQHRSPQGDRSEEVMERRGWQQGVHDAPERCGGFDGDKERR